MQSNYQSIGKWISTLYRYAQNYMSKELESYNIGSGQLIFFGALHEQDGIHQESLARKLNIDKGTTARAIKKLEKEGYVVRKKDPKDRRAYKVFLTEKAIEVGPEIYEILRNWSDVLSRGFTINEKEMVLKLLNQMAENAVLFMEEKYTK